jgi:hypothetical protein
VRERCTRSSAGGRRGGSAKTGHHVGLVRDRVEDVAGEELTRPRPVPAEAAPELGRGRHPLADDDRRVAGRADEGAVGEDLDPVA